MYHSRFCYGIRGRAWEPSFQSSSRKQSLILFCQHCYLEGSASASFCNCQLNFVLFHSLRHKRTRQESDEVNTNISPLLSVKHVLINFTFLQKIVFSYLYNKFPTCSIVYAFSAWIVHKCVNFVLSSDLRCLRDVNIKILFTYLASQTWNFKIHMYILFFSTKWLFCKLIIMVNLKHT